MALASEPADEHDQNELFTTTVAMSMDQHVILVQRCHDDMLVNHKSLVMPACVIHHRIQPKREKILAHTSSPRRSTISSKGRSQDHDVTLTLYHYSKNIVSNRFRKTMCLGGWPNLHKRSVSLWYQLRRQHSTSVWCTCLRAPKGVVGFSGICCST